MYELAIVEAKEGEPKTMTMNDERSVKTRNEIEDELERWLGYHGGFVELHVDRTVGRSEFAPRGEPREPEFSVLLKIEVVRGRAQSFAEIAAKHDDPAALLAAVKAAVLEAQGDHTPRASLTPPRAVAASSDRTRAIVDAAYDVAQHDRQAHTDALDHSGPCLGCAEPLARLQAALALPASPRERDDARRDGIEKAAHALREHLQTKDGWLSIEVSSAGDQTRTLVADLVHALAAPAPEWTRTPPKEPGDYWTRDTSIGCMVELVRVGSGYDDSDPELHVWRFREELCSKLSEWSHAEWWPIPIEPPPSR